MVNSLIVVKADDTQFQHSLGLGDSRAISDDISIHGPHLPSAPGPARNKHGNNTALDRYRRYYHTLHRPACVPMLAGIDPGARSNSEYDTGHHRRNESFRALTGPGERRTACNASGWL